MCRTNLVLHNFIFTAYFLFQITAYMLLGLYRQSETARAVARAVGKILQIFIAEAVSLGDRNFLFKK